MVNLSERNETKEKFIIGEFDFLVDSKNSTTNIDGNKIVDLTIKADQNVFNNLCENDDFEFSYGLYSFEFYAREIELGKKNQVFIDENDLSDYEIGLYFMEHNDVRINLSIQENWILITGLVYIVGREYPIVIKKKIN